MEDDGYGLYDPNDPNVVNGVRYKYVADGRGRTSYDLSETDIRYAMENVKTAAACARFLNVHYDTFKKYASSYTDPDTGKTLFELAKNQGARGTTKISDRRNLRYDLFDILEGKHPKYPIWKLRNRMLSAGVVEEECANCNYNEKRITDETVPLLLDVIDGDEHNLKLENLRMLCLNCWYQLVGNPFKKDKEVFWNYHETNETI